MRDIKPSPEDLVPLGGGEMPRRLDVYVRMFQPVLRTELGLFGFVFGGRDESNACLIEPKCMLYLEIRKKMR